MDEGAAAEEGLEAEGLGLGVGSLGWLWDWDMGFWGLGLWDVGLGIRGFFRNPISPVP